MYHLDVFGGEDGGADGLVGGVADLVLGVEEGGEGGAELPGDWLALHLLLSFLQL